MKPMTYINQYSFTLTAVLVQAVIAIILLRDGVRGLDLVALAGIATAFCLTWLLLRPGQSTLTEVDAVEEALASGKPTLLEFQSEY